MDLLSEQAAVQKWRSYEYIGPGDVFHPVHYEADGGPDNQPYIWADDTMWSIDTPESPHSILPLLFYIINMPAPPLDLIGSKIQLQLRGDKLDLKGGTCLFWIVSSFPHSNRWHLTASPLSIGQDKWEEPDSITITDTPGHWHNSFCREQTYKPTLDKALKMTTSFGISFVNFKEKVTGRLSLGKFCIKSLSKRPPNWPYALQPDKSNCGWQSVLRDTNRQASAEIQSFITRDDNGNQRKVQGIVCPDNFVMFTTPASSFSYLAFVHTDYSTKGHRLGNAVIIIHLYAFELDLKQGGIHFFIEHTGSDTRWIFTRNIEPMVEKSAFVLTEDESLWSRLSGKLSLKQIMRHYDYFGFMIVSSQSTPRGTVCLLDFSIGPNL